MACDSFVYFHRSSRVLGDIISQALCVNPDICLSAGRMGVDFVLGLELSPQPHGLALLLSYVKI